MCSPLKEKLQNTIIKTLPPVVALLLIFGLWVWLCSSGSVPKFMLPPPADVWNAFLGDWELMLRHSQTTLTEISGEDRVAEIARMLSGAVTDASLAHARELLNSDC